MKKAKFRFLAVTRSNDALIVSEDGALPLDCSERIERKSSALSAGCDEGLIDLRVAADDSLALRALKGHLALTDASRRKRHRMLASQRSQKIADSLSFRSTSFNSAGGMVAATGSQCPAIWALGQVNEWAPFSQRFMRKAGPFHLLSGAFAGHHALCSELRRLRRPASLLRNISA